MTIFVFGMDSRSSSNEYQIRLNGYAFENGKSWGKFSRERTLQGTDKISLPCSLILILRKEIVVVNFCVFFLLLSYASWKPSGNISLWSTSLPTGKFGKLTLPFPPGKSDPFCGAGMDIFWNHTFSQTGHRKTQKNYLKFPRKYSWKSCFSTHLYLLLNDFMIFQTFYPLKWTK